MNPNFKYINRRDNKEDIVTTVFIPYPHPAVEIRRRGKTDNWNVFLFLHQGERYTGNLLSGHTVTNADPTTAMLEALTITKSYFSEKFYAIDSLLFEARTNDQVN